MRKKRPLRELDPAEIDDYESRERARIQVLFHGLIRSRAIEGRLPIPRRLPSLATLPLDESEPRWYPVPGMYGGFAYHLERRGHLLSLTTNSWCRVAEGSERRHTITAEQVVLVDR